MNSEILWNILPPKLWCLDKRRKSYLGQISEISKSEKILRIYTTADLLDFSLSWPFLAEKFRIRKFPESSLIMIPTKSVGWNFFQKSWIQVFLKIFELKICLKFYFESLESCTTVRWKFYASTWHVRDLISEADKIFYYNKYQVTLLLLCYSFLQWFYDTLTVNE